MVWLLYGEARASPLYRLSCCMYLHHPGPGLMFGFACALALASPYVLPALHWYSNHPLTDSVMSPHLLHMLLQLSPHVLIVWRPDLKTYTAHITQQLDGAAPINVTINNADVPKPIVQGLGKTLQLWQEDVHVSKDSG